MCNALHVLKAQAPSFLLYRQISNICRTKSKKFNVFRLANSSGTKKRKILRNARIYIGMLFRWDLEIES